MEQHYLTVLFTVLGPWSGYHVLAQHRKLEVILPLHVLFIILTP